MCSAVRRRMLVKGITSSLRSPPSEIYGGGTASCGPSAVRRRHGEPRARAGGRCGTFAAGSGTRHRSAVGGSRRNSQPVPTEASTRRHAMADSTSLRVIRPPSPVPRTAAGSRSCSLSSLRTTGESTSPSPAGEAGRPVGPPVVLVPVTDRSVWSDRGQFGGLSRRLGGRRETPAVRPRPTVRAGADGAASGGARRPTVQPAPTVSQGLRCSRSRPYGGAGELRLRRPAVAEHP